MVGRGWEGERDKREKVGVVVVCINTFLHKTENNHLSVLFLKIF